MHVTSFSVSSPNGSAGRGRIPLGRVGEDPGNEVVMHIHVVGANMVIEW